MSNTQVNIPFSLPSHKLSLYTFSRLTEFDNFSLTSHIYLAKQEQTNYQVLIRKGNLPQLFENKQRNNDSHKKVNKVNNN